jgi:hypothetical protein
MTNSGHPSSRIALPSSRVFIITDHKHAPLNLRVIKQELVVSSDCRNPSGITILWRQSWVSIFANPLGVFGTLLIILPTLSAAFPLLPVEAFSFAGFFPRTTPVEANYFLIHPQASPFCPMGTAKIKHAWIELPEISNPIEHNRS